MKAPRLIGDIIAEIMTDLRELERRYNVDSRDDIISCKAAAAYLGKTPQTISRYIREGRLHKVSNGVITGVRRSELRRLSRKDLSTGCAAE